jgi:hypothetical protein
MKQKINQKDANKSISEELLISVRDSLFKLKDYLNNINFTQEDDNDSKKAKSIIEIVEKLGKAFETLVVLERKVQLEEDIKGKARGNVKVGLFEDGN